MMYAFVYIAASVAGTIIGGLLLWLGMVFAGKIKW